MARLGVAGAVVLPVLGAVVLLLALPSGSFGGSAGPTTTQDRVVGFSGGAEFGASVALSRDGLTAVVGDPDGDRGEVVILTRSSRATSWRRFGLTGGAQKGSGFGTSVAVSANGRVALVGAPLDNRTKGAAWIFTRSGGGNWIGQKLTARDAAGPAAFGFSVALSATGSTALVGGSADNRQKGAAWVFVRSGSAWRQQGNKLTGGREIGAGLFGRSVALSADGEAALIGGPADRNRLGAAWFFLRSSSVWRQQSKLVPPSSVGRGTFLFGSDVALSANGRVALVGAPGLNTSRVRDEVTGAAWILTRSGADWRYRPRLDGGSSDYGFGRSVALSASGDTAAIGTSFRLSRSEVSYRNVGRAYLFSCSTLGCLSTRRGLAPGDVDNDGLDDSPPKFGRDVAVIDGAEAVIVSAPGDPTLVGSPRQIKEPGRAWVFLRWPVVNSVTPAAGPEGGGTTVIVAGENFTKVRGVSFGGKPAVRYTVDSSTRITAVSPPGEGTVHVRVATSVGISEEGRCNIFGCSRNLDFFRYVPRPTVTAINPTSGPSAGGTDVTITGTNLAGGTVRFGARVAAVPVPSSSTEIRVVSPSAPAGTVDVTVTTAGGTSAASTTSRFTYVAPAAERSIAFDDLDTGGPGGAGALVKVTSQYASQGVTFNDVSAIDYEKGSSPLPGFARSGTVAVEQCVGVEFCTSPIRAVFGMPQRMVRVWVGFSFRLNQPVQVELRALDAASATVGTATATLPASPIPTPIGIPLEVRLATASIARFEVSIPGGFNNALAVDDVTVEGG